ncbi:MAG TPA: tetratricopeptide repeat protein, partial [Acidobacteria bacterium]|nr:tetratricopeptide repeat protein [Acidobacteriota bacterium]
RALILSLIATGNLAEAERALKQASLPPDGGGDLLRALILYTKHDDEAALGLLRQESERNPNNPRVLNLLGVTLYDRHRFADAVPIFQRAMELAPDDATIAANLIHARQAAAAATLMEQATTVQNNPKALQN